MDKVEQRALDAMNREPGQQPGESASQYAKRIAAAALREQPEARGVVDVIELGRLLVREREAVGGVFTPDWQLFRAALTAAQQPVQEGGGEAVEHDECPVCENNRRFCANCDSTGFVPATAPPSAPVGDRREIDRVIRELRAYNPAADEYRGEHIHGVWAKELERALAQQPAQAAPGDARAIIEEFVQCAGVGRPPGKLIAQAQDWLAATPPGDDAAGGGHRG